MKIKVISSWRDWLLPNRLVWNGVEFTRDPECDDYDWLVVYDEIPKTLNWVDLKCPRSHTILVTQEPPSIKVYPPPYTKQFRYVLTTHDPNVLRHPGWRRGTGCLIWMNGHSVEENSACRPYEKTNLISAVCSAKQQRHTEHYKRYCLLSYLRQNLPGFEWWGAGIKDLKYKCDALDTYRYHIAIENHIHPYHWTEKISDSILCGCLTFYAGDPALGQVLPPRCFIRIPIDDPPEALRIIREAIREDEYSKRKEDIEAARRLLVERYNLWQQVLDVIAAHTEEGDSAQNAGRLYNRHYQRRNPVNLIREGLEIARVRLFHR